MHENAPVYDVCVVGLGYIGLPTATVLASHGLRVLGVDVNPSAVETINRGSIHITEPGLEDAVRQAVSSGALRAATAPQPADAFVLAVPTPILEDRSADLTYVFTAATDIAPMLKAGDLVVLESTSPPGTTRRIREVVIAERPDLVDADGESTVLFAHAPERVLPGRAMVEIIENDRVVGGLTPAASDAAAALYGRFATGDVLVTDATTAELVKLSENSFRDVNIAFANELATIAAELDVSPWEVIRLANRHPRVNIMQPGPGVGGHCIAVDPWFIVDAAPASARLIRTAREVNDGRPSAVIQAVRDAIGPESRVAVLGLAFKPNIDDLRGSPALAITDTLVHGTPGTTFLISEPNISELPAGIRSLPNAVLIDDIPSAVAEADVVVLLVDHDEYRGLADPSAEGKALIDTRGLWAR